MSPRVLFLVAALALPLGARADSSVAAPAGGDRRVPPNVRIKEPRRPPKEDVRTLLHRIALRVHELAAKYPPLRDFDEQNAIVLLNPAHRETLGYRYGITLVPNPDYDRLTRERAADPRPILRAAIPETVLHLAPDAVSLTIELYPDGGRTLQRVIVPFATVGEITIELRLTVGDGVGPLGEALQRAIIDEILNTTGGRLTVL